MDLSKLEHQPHVQPEQFLLKRLRINMDAPARSNNTKNPLFNVVERTFHTEKGLDCEHAKLQMNVYITTIHSSQQSVKSLDKVTN